MVSGHIALVIIVSHAITKPTHKIVELPDNENVKNKLFRKCFFMYYNVFSAFWKIGVHANTTSLALNVSHQIKDTLRNRIIKQTFHIDQQLRLTTLNNFE